jgi:hypothetical protein
LPLWLKTLIIRLLKLKAHAALQDQLERLRAEQQRVKYVGINTFTENDPHYIEAIKDVAGNEKFRYFLFDMRESLFEQMTKCPKDKEQELIGKIKAVGMITEYLHARTAQS